MSSYSKRRAAEAVGFVLLVWANLALVGLILWEAR